MKKREMILGFFFVLACFFLAPTIKADAYAYTIEKYDVDVKVKKERVYHIEETIHVTFHQGRHGIFRRIPIVSKVKRTDGSEETIRSKVSNVRCGMDHFTKSRDGEYLEIKIGNEDYTIIGDRRYRLSYDYEVGDDSLENNDEFYFNIIGPEWDTTIKNVSFTVWMPDEFDEQNLGMVYGGYGESRTRGLTYEVVANRIEGKLDSSVTLRPKEGVTVRLLLPEGYFEKIKESPWMAWVAYILGFVTIAAGFFLWWIYGRDDPVVETVEFYPPDNLNSVEMAFAWKGRLDSSDVVSLVVYLAQKGYIEIEEKKSKSFTLIRKRPYDGDNEAERVFMEGLFRKGDRVTKGDLENSFYKTINIVKKMVDCRANKVKLFYANSLNKGWILWLLSFACFALAAYVPIADYEYSALMGAGIALGSGLLFMFSFMALFDSGAKLWIRIISFLIFLVPGIIVFRLFVMNALLFADGWYMAAYIFSILASGAAMFFCAYMSKRTEYGTEILGKILGFRNFLETAEKERLEMLVSENPQYFYDILPYTYVLDISKKWMQKFESIAVEAPDWYGSAHTGTVFDIMVFQSFMNSTMSSATSAMTSTPSSSSGGGGGFSGGGVGGGGGGSW